jgi:DNA-binding transcriptional MerR regulator
MTNESSSTMSEKQTEFALNEFTIEPDEIEAIAALEREETLAQNASRIEHDNAGEILDFGTPQLDPSLQAPIEADAELLKEIHAIPAKMAFKIGEAAEMVGVKQYVLRYWETEFEMLRPRKSANGQRVYSRRDVETAMMIKKLLYNDRFSIEGARTALRHLKSTVKSTVAVEKSTEKLVRSQETVVSMLQSLLQDIRRVRAAI